MNYQAIVVRWFKEKNEADTYAGKLSADDYKADVYFAKYFNYADVDGSFADVWIVTGKK
jgi:hypothetical protein